ncbi:hypothetical protein, partial [Vibrio splendidus]|uniref:hypothetical protein n=1 Tax=Vibrio splendidus TaxID=29497 RepID=UPI001A7E085C
KRPMKYTERFSQSSVNPYQDGSLAIRKSRRADSSNRDARYEEREGQIRVSGMRDTKSGKGRFE